jgi:hypothetical protein
LELIKEVVINEEACDYIQRLYYELDGYESCMRSILRCGEFRYNKETYKEFSRDMINTRTEYNLAMEELKSVHIPDYKDQVKISVNFLSMTVSFYKAELNGGCNHENKVC